MNVEQQESATENASAMRYRGKVVSFSDELGWGFIRPDGASGLPAKDVYVNWRNCPEADSQTWRKFLEPGQVVTFEMGKGKTGPQAVNVEVVE